MENRINKLDILSDQIRETYENLTKTSSDTIKQRLVVKLKLQIEEFLETRKNFNICRGCESILSNHKTQRHLIYKCSHGIEVYMDINICNCGKYNILDRERKGSCKGTCSPCDFKLLHRFGQNNDMEGFGYGK